MALEIYKRGQGKYTRGITFAAGTVVAALLARYVWAQLRGTDLNQYVVYAIPLAVFLGGVLGMYLLVTRPGPADFMIATEGEMKKVSWSSRREIIGGTKVVITTTLILALLLWVVDMAFAFFFKWVGVLQVGEGT